MIWCLLGLVLVLGLVAIVLVYRLRCEHLFKVVLDSATDLIMLHDETGKILWVSPSCMFLLGYAPQEILGKHPHEMVHPKDILEHRKLVQGNPKEGFRNTARYRRKDGSYRWFDTIAEPVRDRKGVVRKIRTSSRDVTEFRRTHNLYVFLANHIPNTTVLMFDRSMRAVSIEGHLLRGIEKPEFVSGLFPSEVWPGVQEHFYRAFAKSSTSVEIQVQGRSYQLDCMSVNGAAEGAELGMAVLRDITRDKVLWDALKGRSSALERSNRDLEQFAHVASHEFKSPLRQIAGFSDILREEYRGNLASEADTYLDYIAAGVKRLQEVLDSLLVYARVQQTRSQFQNVDLSVVLDEALSTLADTIEERSVDIVVEDTPPTVYGDAILLRQALENLIENAIKFNVTGRKPLVKIRFQRGPLDWKVSVEDNGPGLQEIYADKVFVMFQRFHPNIPGTGIGLALCKKIAGIHHGKIGYTTVEGVGTTFFFTLPADPFSDPE